MATKEQTALLNNRMAALSREFKRRLEGLEREHVQRLMALFQEFKGAAFAIRNGKPTNTERKVFECTIGLGNNT